MLERRDGEGFIEVLPAQDVVGQHGKSYRFCGYDEIHGYRTWDILEALQPDPTRLDSQQWITSYASIYPPARACRCSISAKAGRHGADPRMLFSWYAADFTTDPDFADATPETPSESFAAVPGRTPGYLEQQQRRLPAHKYRRLHLNLPGLPEGSAFQPEPIMDAVERGVVRRPYESGLTYQAFVDMWGGSSDDAVLAIAHKDADGARRARLCGEPGRPSALRSAGSRRAVRDRARWSISVIVGDRRRLWGPDVRLGLLAPRDRLR